MKKIFLILFLLTSSGAFSQSGYYTKLKVRDSLYAPSRINAGAYYLNGVLQTFGGGGSGTFDTTAFHHFTGINIFSDGTYFQDSVNITGKFIAKGTLVDSLVATYLRSGTVPMARLSDSVFKLSNLDTSNLSQLSQINTNTNLNYFNRKTYIDTVSSYDPLFAQNLVLTTSGASDTIVAVRKFSFYDIASFYIAPLIKSLWDFPFGITTTTIVASALATFNAGLTTTTLTASGTATFNGDMDVNGWTKNQSTDHELQYEKKKIFKFKAGTVASPTTNIAHGLNWHNIFDFGALIKDDTLNFSQQPGQYFTNGFYVRLESLNVVVIIQGTAYGIANDSGYAWVKYLDPNR